MNDTSTKFRSLRSPQELARLLGIDYARHLTYHIYRTPEEDRYQCFEIRKRSGGTRCIRAPATNIKIIQKKLLEILTEIYEPKPSVHGFAINKSILTNAQAHSRSRYVLNIDLENFFPEINFGRVRGLFIAKPYCLPPQVATVIAQICCHENELPQGAPTSPIISNMICAKLDSQLQRLAKQFNCYYTRYADDITFSTRRNSFSKELAIRVTDGERKIATVGPRLKKVITDNGFNINTDKVRLHSRSDRQEVTGLVVNRFTNVRRTYVRQIRAMLHCWRLDGLEAAQKKFDAKYDLANRHPIKQQPLIAEVVRGKIGFLRSVRGDGNPLYRKLCAEYNHLNPKYPIKTLQSQILELLNEAVVIIESDDVVQGTAFFLREIGLVTCAHCVGRNPYVYFPNKPARRIRVEVVVSNETIDLATLKPIESIDNFQELVPQTYSITETGHKIALAGFPAFAPGKSLSYKVGSISGFQMKSGIKRYQVSLGIVAGASGSPVLTPDNKVLGIAVTGADREDTQDNTSDHGAIPISALELLSSNNEVDQNE